MKENIIPVTKTFFPSLEEYNSNLETIWKNEWLTNRGELVVKLEKLLKSFLDVPNLTLTTNGTLPIQIALKVLANGGEVITTPFSYVATTSAIVWENCTPVFVDIHPEYLTIDESKIEDAITDKTTAILATHVFGNPCKVEEIERIAEKHNLKVIYDAAHCFGVKYNGRSIFDYGDISTCSFHATKIFHTGEGGALFSSDNKVHEDLFSHHNFGHDGPVNFRSQGLNAKMSELQAAMGLAVLPHFGEIVDSRKSVVELYDENLNFAKISKLKLRENTQWNYSYYPVIFKSEEELINKQKLLNAKDIFPRRYFYPSLNTLNYVEKIEMPISENISKRILCLPLYVGLNMEIISSITDTINQ